MAVDYNAVLAKTHKEESTWREQGSEGSGAVFILFILMGGKAINSIKIVCLTAILLFRIRKDHSLCLSCILLPLLWS